jgi:hypothetical protein
MTLMDNDTSSAPVTSDSETPNIPQADRPKRFRRFTLKSKKLWLTVILILVLAGLLVGAGLSYHKYSGLKHDYAALKTKNSGLIHRLNQTNTDFVPSVSGSKDLGGVAKQINYALDSDGNPVTSKFVGGTYAPFYLLNKYTVQLPEGLKMERETSINTNGVLRTYKDEGDAGCDITGITMDVASTIYSSARKFEAHGNSATYERAVGCGDGLPATVAYAKYSSVPGIAGQPYKYMEVVIFPCGSNNVTNEGVCKPNGYDPSKWILYTGLVLGNDKPYAKGDKIDYGDPRRSLYDRAAYKVQFYVTCPDSDNGDGCDYRGYSKGYQAALTDKDYLQLKNIVLDTRSY